MPNVESINDKGKFQWLENYWMISILKILSKLIGIVPSYGKKTELYILHFLLPKLKKNAWKMKCVAGQLEKIYNDLFNRVCQLEEEKYDINFVVGQVGIRKRAPSDFVHSRANIEKVLFVKRTQGSTILCTLLPNDAISQYSC